MSIEITVTSDLDKLGKRLERMHQERQFHFIAALAITDVAYKARDAVRKQITTSFSRPTPLTQRSHFAAFANKGTRATKQAPWATIGVVSEVSKGTPPARYLEAEITGGPRPAKPFEKALIRAGVMKAGYFAVPGKGAPLDQYGNIRGGAITQMLSYIRANPDPMSNRPTTPIKKFTSSGSRLGGARAKPKQREFFVVFPNQQISGARKLLPGVYRRTATGFTSFVIFVRKAPRYRVRLPVRAIIERSVKFWFPFAIDKAVAYAMRTNKR